MTYDGENGADRSEEAGTFGIGELAAMFGVTHRAIRFYEDRGLLTPKRVGKTRIFDHRDRVRLDFILRGKRLGFSLADIRQWLDLYDQENGRRLQYETLLRESRKRITDLERQRKDLDATLQELKSIETLALDKLGLAERQAVPATDERGEHGSKPRLTAIGGRKGQMR